MTQQTLEDLTASLPSSITPTFFKPESTPQRVLVNSIEAFGENGRGHVLETKDENGHVIESKKATLYAVVDVLDAETLRSMRWEVLSKPAAVQLTAAVREHAKAGNTSLAGLMVDVSASGRGREKVFSIKRVDEDKLARELEAVKAEVAAVHEGEHAVG